VLVPLVLVPLVLVPLVLVPLVLVPLVLVPLVLVPLVLVPLVLVPLVLVPLVLVPLVLVPPVPASSKAASMRGVVAFPTIPKELPVFGWEIATDGRVAVVRAAVAVVFGAILGVAFEGTFVGLIAIGSSFFVGFNVLFGENSHVNYLRRLIALIAVIAVTAVSETVETVAVIATRHSQSHPSAAGAGWTLCGGHGPGVTGVAGGIVGGNPGDGGPIGGTTAGGR
jgi:hypothetical protein